MTSKADLHAKMAEIVSAVEAIEGVRVEDAHIDEAIDPETANPLAALMGADSGETKEVIHLIAEPTDEPDTEPIDEQHEASDPIRGVDIPIDKGEEVPNNG